VSVLANQPSNLNPLSQIGFSFQLARCPTVEFFIQKANVPGISLPPAPVYTPFVQIPEPGDHMQFGQFGIQFQVDEQMINYMEIFNWITSIAKPRDYTQEIPASQRTSDCTLTILSSAKNPITQITYSDVWPTQLSALQFDATATDVVYVTCDVTFAYRDYTIQTVGIAV
jgi:hypothetical protein